MRDDKSMTRLVMYPLETRLDAFHCRYDDDSWHVLFLQSHGALPQSMEEGMYRWSLGKDGVHEVAYLT